MNIIIAAYTGLGNAILQTPLILGIREVYPASKIYVVGDDKFLALSVIKGLEEVEVLNASTPGKLDFILSKIDLAFLPRFGNTPWLEKKLINKKIRIIKHYDHYLLNPFHSKFKLLSKIKLLIQMLWNKNTLFVPIVPNRHEAELNLDLLRHESSRPISSISTKVGVVPSLEDLIRLDVVKGGYIVVQPSVANGNYSSKRWNHLNFEKVAKSLARDYPILKIVLVGDSGDRQAMDRIEWGSNVINLLGKTSLQEFSSLLKYARVALVHDSGAMHLGAALKSNVIALLGPTDFYRTGPYSDLVDSIYSSNEHIAEMFNFNLTESESSKLSPNFEAMEGISFEAVYSSIRKYL